MNRRKDHHEKIDYIEFPATDMAAARAFFTEVFNWSFQDFGGAYMAFSGAGVDGGFFRSELTVRAAGGSALVVFYSAGLEQTQAKIERAGGAIVKPVFSFPGGRRFHFTDPNGNEYAVWSDLDADGRAIAV
ncbi:MAG: VOC family protein [Gammaproteobacteria bacterium]|nr:VOC family protein [Gammaproteobacteria bacterium]